MTKKIYAYSTEQSRSTEWFGERKGRGLIKVGETNQGSVNQRILDQLQGVPDKQYMLHKSTEAVDVNGNEFSDRDVHKILVEMGCSRLQGTEWFECTDEDINTALTKVIEGYRAKKKTNKGKISIQDTNELKLITPSNVLQLMKEFPEETKTLRDLGKKFKEEYVIVNYSALTLANKIGVIIRALIKSGDVVNDGIFSAPSYRRVNYNDTFSEDYMNELIHKEKRKYTLEDLEQVVITSPTGKTLAELHELTGINKKVIQNSMAQSSKVKVFWVKKTSGFNGSIQKYYAALEPVQLEDDEELLKIFKYDDTVTVHERVVKKIQEILKYTYDEGKALRTIKSKIRNVTIDEIVKCINTRVEDLVIIGLEEAGPDAKVYKKKYAPKDSTPVGKLASIARSKAREKEIEDYIRSSNGVTYADIRKKFKIGVKVGLEYINRIPNIYRYKRRGEDGVLEYRLYGTPQSITAEPTEFMMTTLPEVTVRALARMGVTEELIKRIIEENPTGLRMDYISNKIIEINNLDYTPAAVWNVCRPLLTEMVREGMVVNNPKAICNNRRGWLLYPNTVEQDNIARAITVGETLDTILASLLREYPYGLSARLICERMNITTASLATYFKTAKEVVRVNIYDTISNTSMYRYYCKNAKILLRDGEVIVDDGGDEM